MSARNWVWFLLGLKKLSHLIHVGPVFVLRQGFSLQPWLALESQRSTSFCLRLPSAAKEVYHYHLSAFFFLSSFFFKYKCFACMYVCTTCVADAWKYLRCLPPAHLRATMWELELKPGSSARITNILNRRAISLALHLIFKCMYMLTWSLWELVLCFNNVGTRDGTQVIIRLGSRCFFFFLKPVEPALW